MTAVADGQAKAVCLDEARRLNRQTHWFGRPVASGTWCNYCGGTVQAKAPVMRSKVLVGPRQIINFIGESEDKTCTPCENATESVFGLA